MVQVRNYLVVMLDSVRYDNFVKARTPNIDALGPTEKAYTPACWTLPSLLSFLIIPSYIEYKDLLPVDKDSPIWVPTAFKKKGYYTGLLTTNAWLIAHKAVFSRDFDDFIDFGVNTRWCLPELVEVCLDKMQNKPFFILLHVMETHRPYFDGDQVKAIEYVDRQLGRLLDGLHNTVVVVTADHGDVKGGHHPAYLKRFDWKVFEVPVVKRWLE